MKKLIKGLKKALVIYLVLCLFSTITVNARDGYYDAKASRNIQDSKEKRVKDKLIKKGVPYTDVESIEPSVLERFDNSEDIAIDVKYYRVEADGDIEEVLDDKEIESVLERYDPQSLEDDKEFKISMNPLELLGNEKVEASYIDQVNSYDGYMRSLIMATATNKKYNGYKVYNVYSTNVWIKTPKNRKQDVASVWIDNTMGIISSNSTFPITTTTLHEYTEWIPYNNTYKKGTVSRHNGKLSEVNWKNYSVSGIWSLPDDKSTPNSIKNISDMRCTIDFYVYSKNTSTTTFEAWTEYFHQEATWEFKPVLSFGTGGIGFSFSGNHSKYMFEEKPSAKCDLKIK